MDWATVAAFAAAGISLINVVVTARLSRRVQLEEWRRDEIRPVVERVLALARDTHRAWTQAAISRELQQRSTTEEAAKFQETGQERWDAGKAAWDELSEEVARLDLIASEPVRKAADALKLRLESMGLRLRPHRDCLYPLNALELDIYTPMLDLTSSTRAEIGLGQEAARRGWHIAGWRPRRRTVAPPEPKGHLAASAEPPGTRRA